MQYLELVAKAWELTKIVLVMLLVTVTLASCTFRKTINTEKPGVEQSTYRLSLFGTGEPEKKKEVPPWRSS